MWHKGFRWHHVESDILKEGPVQKHPGRWEVAEHQIPSIKVLFKKIAKVTVILVLDYLWESKTQLNVMGRSFTNAEWHSCCVYIYTSYNRTHIKNAYIYICFNTELLDGNKGHQLETHRPTHRFRRLFLDMLSMGWRGSYSAMGAIKLPPSCSSPKLICQSIHIA